MAKFKNLSGHRFGMLYVVRYTDTINKRSIFECRCDCGNTRTAKGKDLLKGDVKSCGCLRVLSAIKNGRNSATHGLTKHPLYGVWSSMKDRCLNVKCHAYKDYGGRGIGVSEEWLSFETFYADVFPTYVQGLELDRSDNNGDYGKNNFRWATPVINKRNRRNTVFLTVDGVKRPLGEWVDITGVSRHSIWGRIKDGLQGMEALYGIRYLNRNGKTVY